MIKYTVSFSLFQCILNIWVTHIGWSFICDGHAAEDEGITVILCGGARFTHTFEELPHGSELSLSDKTLTCSDVDGLGLQLEVLRQTKFILFCTVWWISLDYLCAHRAT